MGLYDIFDEIAEHRILKTETGDNRLFGFVLGIVVDNYEEKMPGRVCVNVPVRDKEANELKWARVVMPSGGARWGHYFLPEVGDQVLLGFEQGNIERPYVIGCVQKDADQFLTKTKDEDNRYKKIVSRNGNAIVFEDAREGDGDQDKLSLMTANKGRRIVMDNENNTIVISDKENKNQIEQNSDRGTLQIKAEKKLNIVIGNQDVSIKMDADQGTLEIKCRKLKISCDDKISMQSLGQMQLEGGNVTLSGSTTLRLSGEGITKIEGKPVNIG